MIGASVGWGSYRPCFTRFRRRQKSSGYFATRSGRRSKAKSLWRSSTASAGRAAAPSASPACRFTKRCRSRCGTWRPSRPACRCTGCSGRGATEVEAYASGLDFHLSDKDFVEFFGHADSLGYRAFKIKVGHPDFEWDLNRLSLVSKAVRPGALLMIDANEAWGAKEALVKLETIHRLGYRLMWVEDPILRHDFEGLRMLRNGAPWTQINSGEYLDAAGKRQLMLAGGTDILNVHGQVTDVMRIGWLAAEMGIPVSLGNTFLETGVHTACALPEVQWLEYSFQNFDHIVDEPMQIRDGWIHAPDRPGHGLVLSEAARTSWARPQHLSRDELGPAPHNPRVAQGPKLAAHSG